MLEFNVDYPQQCVQSLQKLSDLLASEQNDLKPTVLAVFALQVTDEPEILHSLVQMSKKVLKRFPELYSNVYAMLATIFKRYQYKAETYPVLVDALLAVVFCVPQSADILIERSLPEGCQALFPVGVFEEILQLFVQNGTPKPLLQCMSIRLLQFRDLYFHALAFIARDGVLRANPTRQLAQLAHTLLLHEELPTPFYLPDIAQQLAVPVGSTYTLEFYMRLVPKAYQNCAQQEPFYKPAQYAQIDVKAALAARSGRKRSNNEKFLENYFECYYQIPYADTDFVNMLKTRFLKLFLEDFSLFHDQNKDGCLMLLKTARAFDMNANFDYLYDIYSGYEDCRLAILSLLVSAQRSDKYVHQVFDKIYDNITGCTLNNENEDAAMFMILRQVVRNQQIELFAKAAFICKLCSCLLLLNAVPAFVSVLVVFAAVLRDMRLRGLIDAYGGDFYCAYQVVRDRDFASAAAFIYYNYAKINLAELGVLAKSIFTPLSNYLQRLQQGECLDNDLDLDYYINLRLDQAIAGKLGEKLAVAQRDPDMNYLYKRLFEAPSAEHFKQFSPDFVNKIDRPLESFLTDKIAENQKSELVAGNSLKMAKLQLQKQIEAEMTRLFAWPSDTVETKVTDRRVMENEAEEPIEEYWGAYHEE